MFYQLSLLFQEIACSDLSINYFQIDQKQSELQLDARLEKKFIAGVETLISKDPSVSSKLSRHLIQREAVSNQGSNKSLSSRQTKKKVIPVYRSIPKVMFQIDSRSMF